MKKIGLEIVGLSYSQTQSGAYALVLGEKEGKRRLPIIIGGFEAQSIAVELENMKPSRPLTHDLFKSFSDAFDIKIKEVIIYNLVEGIFYSKLICDNKGKEEEIDARTSDAIAIAVRFKCDIFTYESILSQSGIILEDTLAQSDDKIEEIKEKKQGKEIKEKDYDTYSRLSVKDLEKKMGKAVEAENYEEAARLKKELDKRKEN